MLNVKKSSISLKFMNTEEILSLPFLDRLKYVKSLNDTFGFLKKLKSEKSELPSELESLLKRLEKLNVFNEFKQIWCRKYPNFAEISRIMELYLTSEVLIEFREKSLPESFLSRALEVFKKTISFKTSSTDKKLTNGLTNSRYRYYKYCITKEIAISFQDEFLDWGIEISNLWQEVYYSKEDFFNNTGYDRTSWETYIKYPSMLEQKKDELKKQLEKAFALMASGIELIENQDIIITQEYKNNGVEMSLYERELEISLMVELENENDEQYCYVYTLECELVLFYVGIASNPKERFEQHIRGAFSNESHLFKSKFIQKYHNQIKQNIVYEGIRRDCKISWFNQWRSFIFSR